MSVASRRGPLVLGVLCGTLLLLFVLLFLGIEHSRQKVRTYRAELESRGESFRIADLAANTPASSNEAGRELLAGVMHQKATTLQNSQEVAWTQQEQTLRPAQSALNRLARAAQSHPEIARDGEAFQSNWHAIWDEVEEHYFTRACPPESFDLVVANT